MGVLLQDIGREDRKEHHADNDGSSTQTTFPTAVTGKIAAPTVVTFIQAHQSASP